MQAFNVGVKKLGAPMGTLFLNMVTVSVIAVRAVTGEAAHANEILGAALVGMGLALTAWTPAARRPPPDRRRRRRRRRGPAQVPALKFVKTRVCTRRMSCGTGSGTCMRALSSSLRKMLGFDATSGLTNFSDARFGLA